MATGAEVVVAIGKTAGAVSFLAKSSTFAVRHTKRMIHKIKYGDVFIPIFGAGGVGKSTAGKIIAGMSPSDAATAYEESLWTEVIKLTGDVPGELKVAPGQGWRRNKHWPKLYQSVVNGKAKGIINVVSYGYHSMGLPSVRGSSLWKDGMTMEEFLPLYLEERRREEIELAQSLVAGLTAVTEPLWMVTLINKQDFWYHEEDAVLDHYRNGEYGAAVAEFGSRIGSNDFQHEIIPVALTISNLTSGSGEVLATNEEGYDIPARDRSLKAMSEKIDLLVSK